MPIRDTTAIAPSASNKGRSMADRIDTMRLQREASRLILAVKAERLTKAADDRYASIGQVESHLLKVVEAYAAYVADTAVLNELETNSLYREG